jgi:hypothetical protein
VKNLATRAILKQLNPNTIDITKVPSMPLKNEEKNHYAFLRQEAFEKQFQRGRQVWPTPLLDLENSNDNASSSEFDDYVENSDHSVNDQGVQIDCEKLNKTTTRHIRRIWFK